MSAPRPRPDWHVETVRTLLRTARRHPERPAVVDLRGTTTFRALYAAASRDALTYETQSLHFGGVVAIPATPTAGFAAKVLGALLAGVTPLPVSDLAPTDLIDAAVTTVLEARDAGCRPWKATLTATAGRHIPVLTHGEPPSTPRKGHAIGLVEGGTAFIASPLHHNGPFDFMLRQLLMGGTVILAPRFDPGLWLWSVRTLHPDWAFLTPAHMRSVWDTEPEKQLRRDCASLRLLVHPAAPGLHELRTRVDRTLRPSRVAEYYGTSLHEGTFAHHSSPQPGGAPIPGAELRTVDRRRWPVAPGVEGTLEGRSTAGLVHHFADLPCPDRLQWRSVGEQGLRVPGSDRFAVTHVAVPGHALVAGVDVSFSDTRDALLAHPAVASCSISTRPDPLLGAVLTATVRTSDVGLTEADLRSWCAARLTAPQRPYAIAIRRVPRPSSHVTAKGAQRHAPM